jgi:hypothetical protein
MYCIKFVTKDYLSPNIPYRKLDYSNFGVPIEINCDPADFGQCGRGIHVIPLVENANFENCLFSDKCIILDIDEDDIIYQENNGKMRVKRATPLGDFDRDHPLWDIMLKNIEFAYYYAYFIDKCAKDDTRSAVLSNPKYAYKYAKNIDVCARDDTRSAVLSDPNLTYYYAEEIDQCPRDDTRNAVLSTPEYAYFYAIYIDKCAREDTRNVMLSDYYYAYNYAVNIDKCARDDTRNTVYKDPYYKKMYIQVFGE